MNMCTGPNDARLGLVRNELIDRFENRFACTQGEPKAFFEIPQRGADPVRGVYVVYSVRGLVLDEVRAYFIKEVIEPLAMSAASDNDTDVIGGPFLYWRLAEKLEVRQDGKWFTIYTRVCVLDDNLDSIVLDIAKTEGGPTPICAYSAGAY